MDWKEVIEHPSLKDLPFKIETNEWGNILMTPASDKHGIYQSLVVRLLGRLAAQGWTSTECPIQTSGGVKVADVAWRSVAFLKKHGLENLSLPGSPEIVVEVPAPSNNPAEMEGKRRLYFQAGAKEFWLCDGYGDARFFSPRGETEKSGMFPEFPSHIEIEVV